MLLFTATPMEQTDWMDYAVEAGEHDFKPNDFPAPYFGADTYQATFSFTPSCWWSIEDEDYTGANDIYDWNKIGGMTNYFNANSTHSVLLAWRPAKSSNVIEVTAYINPKSGRFVTGPVVSVPVGERMQAQIKWSADNVQFDYGGAQFTHAVEKPWAIRKIGPWFGGNQPAHRAMQIKMESTLK
jgi:hypothetical protein